MGANALAGSLSEYTVCPAGKTLQYVNNSCIDCPSGQVYVLAAGLCACDIGYAQSAASRSDLCGECQSSWSTTAVCIVTEFPWLVILLAGRASPTVHAIIYFADLAHTR